MRSTRVGAWIVAVSVLACSPGGREVATPAAEADAADPSRPLPSPVPSVVARVNGRPITLVQILPLAKALLDRVPATEREKMKPAALRRSLDRYVERELLLQEALARGVDADTRAVDWAYDQARLAYPDDAAWTEHLASEGSTPESFRAELRIQQTIAALLREEVLGAPISPEEVRSAYDANPAGFGSAEAGQPAPFESVRVEVERAVRQSKQGPIGAALLARLRAKARIELLL